MRLSGDGKLKGWSRWAAKARFSVARHALITAELGVGDQTIRFVCRTRRELRRAETLHVKEPGTVALLRDELRQGDVVWDIGANVGVYSILAAARIGAQGKVYAIEPMAANYARLLENILANQQEDRIVPLSVALSRESGFLPFHYEDATGGATGSQLRDAVDHRGVAFRPVLTEVKYAATGDELFEGGHLRAPDVVKIDVDGQEGDVLFGMRGVLTASPPRILLVEISPHNRASIERFMSELGYALTEEHFTSGGAKALAAGEAKASLVLNGVFRPEHARLASGD